MVGRKQSVRRRFVVPAMPSSHQCYYPVWKWHGLCNNGIIVSRRGARRKRERYRNRIDFYLLRDVSQWAVSRASSLRDRSWLGFLQLVRVRDEKWTDDVIAEMAIYDVFVEAKNSFRVVLEENIPSNALLFSITRRHEVYASVKSPIRRDTSRKFFGARLLERNRGCHDNDTLYNRTTRDTILVAKMDE